ncbi:UDP-glucose 4-epimerase [Halobacteriovorax marinus SJ]|uniref:UDP-glucose 4-epimerase n=1 Tax=Halobacteriovorax marinus (strain ATCC BAA-682 / DSM 15412 / SJ) TaxID=862908 RepID=E1X3F7_HALMS|nr:UDP-glucose 4-epimerase GalE [Halobacteriovorax marinus]CBW25252.1 UDP-glucose 4-epimerase [Halobacteriovorax marinus SJ]
MAKILVTGGAGYIGSHIVNLLRSTEHEVVVYDDLSTGRRESVTFGRLVVGELEDIEKLEGLIQEERFDACFHFAGSIIVPESVENPLKYYNNNTQNTLDLINLCVENNINKFIFSSTAAVYGEPAGGVCTEETSTNPINPYGRTKLMTEWMLQDVAKAHKDFEYIALRYFNVAGASVDGRVGQCSPLSTHLIKLACEAALGKREELLIFGDDYETRDGTCIRDYIHTDDLARAHLDALDYLLGGGKSEVMNCGYGNGFTVKEVIDVVKRVSGVNFRVKVAPRRDGDPPVLMSKTEKISKKLRWKPKYNDLSVIVKTALDWEREL